MLGPRPHLAPATLVSILAFFASASAEAQSGVPRDAYIWLSASSTVELPGRTQIAVEMHERRFAQSWRPHQRVYRGHFAYQISRTGRLGFGYTHFLQGAVVDSGADQPFAAEVRPHVQFDLGRSLSPAARLTQRSRLEYRDWRASSGRAPMSAVRLRHRVQLDWTPNGGPIGLRISDELHIQTGDRPASRLFEQNRVQVGLRVPITGSLSTELAYLWWYQQRRDGATVQRDHFRIAFEHLHRRRDTSSIDRSPNAQR